MARVYIISGDLGSCEDIIQILDDDGHEHISFKTGKSGLGRILADPPDAVIADLYQDDIDGFELLLALRREGSDVPVVSMADAKVDDNLPMLATASLLGAASVLARPATPVIIRKALYQALERRSKPRPETTAPLPTKFAPAERADEATLTAQAAAAQAHDLLNEVMSSLPNLLLVVNAERQIVFANQAVLDLSQKGQSEIRGMRPGELVNCVHSAEESGGCGTSDACRVCGVMHAMLKAQKGDADTREARLSLTSGDPLDLRVSTRPVEVEGEQFVTISLTDISSEKRRRVLERVFFHDVMNTAGGVRGLADMLQDASPEDQRDVIDLLTKASHQLVREIESQRLLSAAESGEYERIWAKASVGSSVEEALAAREVQAAELDVRLKLEIDAPELEFTTDSAMLGRVIGNLTKNAVEASNSGMSVTVSAELDKDAVLFRVHNETGMPKNVELQVFQRSFSTKGVGRGMGTYSVKLFTERFLLGRVWFETSPTTGTTFFVRIPREPAVESLSGEKAAENVV